MVISEPTLVRDTLKPQVTIPIVQQKNGQSLSSENGSLVVQQTNSSDAQRRFPRCTKPLPSLPSSGRPRCTKPLPPLPSDAVSSVENQEQVEGRKCLSFFIVIFL